MAKMRILLHDKNRISIGILILILVEEGYFFQIPTYKNVCNETITLDNNKGAGRLHYTHYPHLNEQRCTIVVETEPSNHIGYVFVETSAFRTINIQNDHIYYTCTSFILNEGGTERKYGCVNDHYTNKLQTTYSNTLTINVHADELTYFNFELLFFSFHYGHCNSYEVSCYLFLKESDSGEYRSACIDHNLPYERNFHFCDLYTSEGSDYPSDIVTDKTNFNGSLIAAIVLLCIIFIPLLILSGCLIFRKYCKQPEQDPEDIPTRARRIFAIITAEAQENAGYDTGPIDPNTFDPPPDYGSLEDLEDTSNDKRFSQISIECPPSYSDVMKNSNEFLVSGHI